MLKLTRWCIRHRRRVFVAWLAIAVLTTVVAGAVGRNYATNFSLPGTQSQHALDLLKKRVPRPERRRRHDRVPHRERHVDRPAVKAAIEGAARPSVAERSRMSSSVLSPYGTDGAVEVSSDRRTAFATINYDKPANQRPERRRQTGARPDRGGEVPGLKVAAGGQVMENAEGFSVGPATADRGDRGADHPAVHVRLADRRRDAAGHRRIRPDHRRRADRPGHARDRASRTSPRTWR